MWDYQTKKSVAVLEGHTNNVTAVCAHPSIPIILSGSEVGVGCAMRLARVLFFRAGASV